MRLRVAALVLLAAALPAPARAVAPLTLLAGTDDGGLVRVTMTADGVVTARHRLIGAAPRRVLTPAQVTGGVASVMAFRFDARNVDRMWFDSMMVSPASGRVASRTTDGRTGQVLLSPDGKWRYLVTTDGGGLYTGLYRADARGRGRKVLVEPEARHLLSSPALSPDGRTIYVARMPYGRRATLYAIDTATGTRREIVYAAPFNWVTSLAVSPDGKTLGISFFDEVLVRSYVGLLDPVTGAVRLFVHLDQLMGMSEFTPDGSHVLLTDISEARPTLALADTTTLLVTPVVASEGLQFAVPVS